MAKQTIDELAVIITANAERVKPDLDKAQKEFQKFVADLNKTMRPEPVKPPDVSQVKKVARDVAEARGSIRAAGGDLARFAATVAATGGTLLAVELGLNGVAGAFQHLKDSVRMAADLESTTLSFEVMLGSAERARSMLAEIRQYAATTPFNNRELTAAARQLVAYNFAAEQVLPTLKMLGDVSSAVQKPIGEVAYLYGTLRTQGRAYARDINQFTTAGIDIVPQLAAVMGRHQYEIRDLVEEGRVEFRDVEAAFKRMTSEGGRFYQLTARQGQTLSGVIEQMADAWDLVKLELGKVIVEEAGLKEGARDLEAFAHRVRENVGELRPAVKLAGDLARAGAQIGYEFTRAGIAVGSMNLDAIGRSFPQLKAAADSFQQLLEDAKNFKIDEERLINFGSDVAEATVWTFGAIADTIKKLWDEAQAHAGPVLRTFEAIDSLIRQVRGADHVPPALARDAARPNLSGLGRLIDRPAAPPPRPDDPDRLRRDYQALTAEVVAAEDALLRARVEAARNPRRPSLESVRAFNVLEARVAAAHRARGEFVHGNFPGEGEALTRLLDSGIIPPMHGHLLAPPPIAAGEAGRMAALGPAGLFPAEAKTFAQAAREAVEEMRQTLLAASRARREAQAAEREAAESRAAVRAALFGPAAVLQSPPPQLEGQLLGLTAAVGPAGMFHTEPRADLFRLALALRKEYDPRRELQDYRKQLDEIKARRMLGPNTDAFVERAWRERLGEAAGKLGIEHRYQLPEAAEVGSREDARIITAWRAEGRNPSAEQLWQRITTAVETLVQIEQQRGVRLPVAPPPRVVQLPGE